MMKMVTTAAIAPGSLSVYCTFNQIILFNANLEDGSWKSMKCAQSYTERSLETGIPDSTHFYK